MPPTLEQRIKHINRANYIRLGRAEIKRQLKRREIGVKDIIMNPPEVAENMPISELLMAQDRWGVTRMRKLLNRVRIPEMKPLSTLTERQRNEICTYL